MRILVTGGSGFLGAAFVRLAVARGHAVAVLSRQPDAGWPSSVHPLVGSFQDVPWSKIRSFAPEACVHLAWIATPGIYLESPENHAWVRWSLEFFGPLPELGVRSIVAVGTCIEYQMTGAPLVEETTPLRPLSTYALCKHELHLQLRALLSVQGISLAWARVFYPYGEGEHPGRLISSLLTRLRMGEPVLLKTPRSVKDYIHVDDVAAALLILSEKSFHGAVNIGTGKGVAVENVARRLAELLDHPELICVPEFVVADPLDFVVADSMRIRSLGWHPELDLETGLQRLVERSRR